jgi:hypothetical protein
MDVACRTLPVEEASIMCTLHTHVVNKEKRDSGKLRQTDREMLEQWKEVKRDGLRIRHRCH